MSLTPALIHNRLHFPFAFLLSSIISTTDELFNEFDFKQCLNTSVMAVLTMTPSLGPNLCYWPAEDELSAGEKNQRVWNGKWYTTVAYRGNLYYKLPRCTVAEPQIALSFSVCMSLYAQWVYVRYMQSVVCVSWLCLVFLFSYEKKDLHVICFVVSFVLACMLLSTHTHTLAHRDTHTSLDPVPLHEPSSNTSHGKHEACFCDWSDHPFSLSPTLSLPHTHTHTHTITVISVFTSTSFGME